jgi:hypothetical protein
MAKSNIVQGSFLEQCDCDIISFLDTSTYLPNITNPILRIFPPNWSEYINIPYNLNQITLITPGLLKHSTLPSGVYKIIQSVCPNDKSFKEYCYLQICKDLQCLKEIVCEYSEDEIIMNKVFTLKMQLEAAQDLVYECDVNKGTELYNITVNQIKDLKNGMCSL